MATWIVHLRIAENLLELIPGLDAGQFAIGNTAPDSGVPDENWENFDPPPATTHFLSLEKEWDGSADISFYQHYLSDIDRLNDKECFSFRFGYFCHLLADNLWMADIYRPAKKRYADDFSAIPKLNSRMKKDWYGLDLAYVRDHPAFLFWHIYLDAKPDACDLDFLPLSAVNQQLSYIKGFYKEYKKSLPNYSSPPYLYLTQDKVDNFIEKATQEIHSIYQRIWLEKQPIPNKKSMLSVFSQS
ncbi:MAG: zinc dependent phospholipase C family protein [Chloroflexi bacterium]|nr:zinc dependent phospholipase C family protein [Chloroflexota bacterium]